MAKKIKTPKSENSIIGKWVQSNEQKLEEIETVNPELFSAVGAVLNYLNTYLGGSSEIKLASKSPTKKLESSTDLPYPYALLQWRVKPIDYFETKYNLMKIKFLLEIKEKLIVIAQRPLFSFINDNDGLNKICKYGSTIHSDAFFSNIGISLSIDDIHLWYQDIPNESRPEKIRWIGDYVEYCNKKISDSFAYFYENNSFDSNPIFKANDEDAISLKNDPWTLNEYELYFLQQISSVAWWGYQYASVGFRKDEFLKGTFINEKDEEFKVLSIISHNIYDYMVTFVDLQSLDSPTNYIIKRVEMAKALLGLSFTAEMDRGINITTYQKEIFQATSLPNKKRLPITIGDTVELVVNQGMAANVGAKALVIGVYLWDAQSISETISGINTMIDVVWINEESSNNQSDGGYLMQNFRNLTRPEYSEINDLFSPNSNQEDFIWRVKTSEEMVRDFGANWRALTSWALRVGGDMDIETLGKPLIEILNPTDYEIFLNNPLGSYTFLTKDGWNITNKVFTKLPLLEEEPTTLDPLKSDFKIQVNNETEAKAFQEWAFSKGVVWWSTKNQDISNTNEKYFFVENGTLTYAEDNDTFELNKITQLSLDDLNIKVVTPKPKPKNIIDPLKTNIKIKVQNESESKAFQEWAFSKGAKWAIDGQTLSFLDELFFIIEDGGQLMYYGKKAPDAEDLFNGDDAKLVTLEELGIVVPTTNAVSKSIDPLTDSIKIEVQNKSEAKAFQEWAFSKGVKWRGINNQKIFNLDRKYFYIEDGKLSFGDSDSVFNIEKHKKVTLDDLEITIKGKTPITRSPRPKKTTKFVHNLPKIKPDVQDLYGELDDLDI